MSRARLALPAYVTVWDGSRSGPRPLMVLAVLLALLLPIALAVNPPSAEAAVSYTLVTPDPSTGVSIDLASVAVEFDGEVATESALTLTDGDGATQSVATGGLTPGLSDDATPTTTTTVTYLLSGVTLDYDTTYDLEFTVVAVTDSTVTTVDDLSFTTESEPLPDDLVLSSIVPIDGATGVEPASPAVIATFNNELATVSALTLTASGTTDTITVSTSALSLGDTRVTFTSSGVLLDRGTTYELDFTATDVNDDELVVSGTFTTAAKLVQTITLDPVAPPDLRVDQGPVVVTATTNSDLEVTFTSTNTGVCTVGTPVYDADAGTTVASLQLAGVGTCAFTAAQAGDGQYASTTTDTRSFAVTAAPVEPPTFFVSPATFAPGDLVTVSGSGWGFAEQITLALVAVGDGQITPIGTVAARIDGSLSETFLAPDAKVGEYLLTANGAATATQASAVVTVREATVVDDTTNEATPDGGTGDGTGDADALPLTGFDRAAPFAFLGALLALTGMLVVTRAGRSPWAQLAVVEDPSGWGKPRRHDEGPPPGPAPSSASSQRVQLTASLAGAVPVTDPETDASSDGRRYLTAGDIEQLAADGQQQLVLDADTTLTDQALAKVRLLGLSVVHSDAVTDGPGDGEADADTKRPATTPRAELFARLRRRRS